MGPYFDFKAFRTAGHLRAAMITYCRAVRTRTGIKGICPRFLCVQKQSWTLKTSNRCRVAYCHACGFSLDALQILREAKECSYEEACNELASVIVSG